MQAKPPLGQITTSHFWVLITETANGNIPTMILIAYLNENLPDCTENLMGGKQELGKQEPLIHSYMLWYSIDDEKLVKNPLQVVFM